MPDKSYEVDVSKLPHRRTVRGNVAPAVPAAEAQTARGCARRDAHAPGVAACADQSAQAANKLEADAALGVCQGHVKLTMGGRTASSSLPSALPVISSADLALDRGAIARVELRGR